ncbi:MAG: hypothetical protein OEX02_06110 [Cyclobacteriaceae bacterium]|nr:hypothetical protein [Cyclobacteriaceae bacterium]
MDKRWNHELFLHAKVNIRIIAHKKTIAWGNAAAAQGTYPV